MVFEALKIDNTLEAAEKTAIDNLKIDDKNTAEVFKTALKNEKIGGVDQSFLDIATAFSQYKVEFSVTEGTATVKSETIAKCDDKAPQRLKNLIADKDSNDLVYFMYKISVLLKVGEEKDLEKETFGLKTIQQLKNLKTEIEKTTTAEVSTTETLEAKDITFTLYSGVTPDQVVAAGEKLKIADPTLAQKIIPLLTSGDVKGVQEALGMSNDATELYKKADGKFGKRTLTNLEAGKIIVQKDTRNAKTGAKEIDERKTLKEYTITMYNKPYIFQLNEATRSDLEYLKDTYGFEKVFWDIKDRFDDGGGELTDFPLKYAFVQSIKKDFENDEWKKEKNTNGVAYATIEEYIDGMKLHKLVEKIKKNKDKKEAAQSGATTENSWDSTDIDTQLSEYKLSETELDNVKKIILTKKTDLDYGESGNIYFVIKDKKINIYSKTDYMKQKKEVKTQLRLNNISEIKRGLPTEKDLVATADKKLTFALSSLRGITFDNKNQWKLFIEGVNSLLDTYAYKLQEKPFTISAKGNISFKPVGSETFFEDNANKKLGQIENYKGRSEDYRDEIVTITDYLNGLDCWVTAE